VDCPMGRKSTSSAQHTAISWHLNHLNARCITVRLDTQSDFPFLASCVNMSLQSKNRSSIHSMRTALDIDKLIQEAALFAQAETNHDEPTLYGVTDGKAVGTYLEHKFKLHLSTLHTYEPGSSASGIDFPGLPVDLKVTSVNQPQSSCPFKSARQKIYGLGYHLLVFVYEKSDDHTLQTARLSILTPAL
jgi:hypothetical protein